MLIPQTGGDCPPSQGTRCRLDRRISDERVRESAPALRAHDKIRAACAAHRKTNCLTESTSEEEARTDEAVLFTEALEEARQKDLVHQDTSKAEGEFWGLPCSFKGKKHSSARLTVRQLQRYRR